MSLVPSEELFSGYFFSCRSMSTREISYSLLAHLYDPRSDEAFVQVFKRN